MILLKGGGSPMLSLTKIFLYNWHRFDNHLFPVKGDLYLTGENGTGKSTILDALQLVLIGDRKQIRFNQAAQNERIRSTRTLETYVLAKTDEELLRQGNTVAYVVLEFTDTEHLEQRTIGVCIEAGPEKPAERTHFILSEGLDPDLYVVNDRPRPRRELRQVLKERRFAAVYDQGEIERYQEDVLNRLGGLNRLFFDLLGQALTFKPIYDVHDFVSQMILPGEPIDLKSMQEAQQRLKEMELLAEQVKAKIGELQIIVQDQAQVRDFKRTSEGYQLLLALLQREKVTQTIADLDRQIGRKAKELRELEGELFQVQEGISSAEKEKDAALERLTQHAGKVQHDRLTNAIREETKQLEAIQRRWATLQQTLQLIREGLDTVLGADVDMLSDEERLGIESILEAVAHLTPDVQSTQSMAHFIEQTLPHITSARTHIQNTHFELSKLIQELRQQGQALEQIQREIERENRVRYPEAVERLRSYMEQRLGYRPQLVCELLEVPEERWQDAVEAQLGMRRFAMVVPAAQFDAALKILDDARATQRIYGIGLLDLQRLQERPQSPQAGSLALKVQTKDEAIRPYVDMVLGRIMTCESITELRNYRRAITPEVMVYNEAMVYAVDPKTFKPLCIGSRAKQIQLEETQRQLMDIGDQLAAFVPQVTVLEGCSTSFNRLNNNLNKIQPTLNEPLDDQPLLLSLAQHQQELQALDLTTVKELEDEVESWREQLKVLRRKEQQLFESKSKVEEKKQGHENAKIIEQNTLPEHQRQLEHLYATYPSAVQTAEQMYTELYLTGPNRNTSSLDNAIKAVEERRSNADGATANARLELVKKAERYNTTYTFRAKLQEPEDEESYAVELQRLTETELPQQQALIIQVRRNTEDQLRQDLLHRLSEQINNANRTFSRINAILTKIKFHERSYQLKCLPHEELRDYYDVIMASASLGEGSLFESLFYQEHRETCDRLFDALLISPRTPEEQKRQNRLVDYRNYLSYDILITNPDGRTTSLKRTLLQRSGGETQTPFYVAIAAAFASLYKFGEQSRRPSIRLAIFDEAFSKMDQRYIDSTLEVFRLFNLQIVTATPPDRSPYLGPHMDTSLALVLQNNTVRVEPLRRYLDESTEQA